MPSPISMLYEPLISRELKAVPAAVRKFRKSHAPDELFEAISRFALLSYSPSQHGKHAVLACLAAHDLRRELRGQFDDVLTECAIYAAQSRQPWSEPPITDPPPIPEDQPGAIEEMLAAMAAGDRLRGERWLAKRVNDPDLESDFFGAAASDLSDLGHKLNVAVAAWRLAEVLGEKGRFATLRVAVTEWTAYRGEELNNEVTDVDTEELLRRMIARLVSEAGSMLAFHPIALLDSAILASEIADDSSLQKRVESRLDRELKQLSIAPNDALEIRERPFTPYRLAKDYGQCLKAFAIARRLQGQFPDVDCGAIVAASQHNLRHGPSFEEWSFA